MSIVFTCILRCQTVFKKTTTLYGKKADSSVVLIIFNGVLYHVRVYTLDVSSISICTREAISWYITNRYPVNAHLTTQIEPVQEKVIYQPV